MWIVDDLVVIGGVFIMLYAVARIAEIAFDMTYEED